MNKIKIVSLLLRLLLQTLVVAIPIILIVAWVQAPKTLALFHHIITMQAVPGDWPILSPLSADTKVYGFLVSLIPAGVVLCTLYFLIKLFRAFEKGEIFSISNTKTIRNIGYTILTGQILHPFYDALMSFVLTWHNPPGHRIISISESGTNIGLLLVAALIILISWVMLEAYKLHHDQQLTI